MKTNLLKNVEWKLCSCLVLILLFQHSYLLKSAKNYVNWEGGLPHNNFHEIWTEI